MFDYFVGCFFRLLEAYLGKVFLSLKKIRILKRQKKKKQTNFQLYTSVGGLNILVPVLESYIQSFKVSRDVLIMSHFEKRVLYSIPFWYRTPTGKGPVFRLHFYDQQMRANCFALEKCKFM